MGNVRSEPERPNLTPVNLKYLKEIEAVARYSKILFSLFAGAWSTLVALAAASSIVGALPKNVLVISGLAAITLTLLITVTERLLAGKTTKIANLKDQVTSAYLQALESSLLNPLSAKK